jgi:uncharacterized membrane protein
MGTAVRQRGICLQFAATIVACTMFCLATPASAQQPAVKVQSYTEVKRSAGVFQTQQIAISKDGSTALGGFTNFQDNDISFYRWSQSGGTDGLSGHKGAVSSPPVLSASGAMVAGSFTKLGLSANQYVFTWSKAGGFREIVKLSYWYQAPNVDFVSDDGSVVIFVAKCLDPKNDKARGTHLIRWSKARGAQDLGGMKDLSVEGVSADGWEIVGQTGDSGNRRGFRWTQQGGLQDFPAMDRPLGVSADGAVILGTKADHVIRWTQAGGAEDMGTLGAAAIPLSASADAMAIVGWQLTGHAFLWTQAGGAKDLSKLGGLLAQLVGVSADGTVVAGYFQDASGTTVQFVSPVADLVVKAQAELKQEQALAQAQAAAKAQQQAKAAAAQAEESAKTAAIQADQQARYNKVIKTGRPAQLYSLAGHLEDEGRPDLAANLYQALIDRFPDDPYTAKAIEKQDTARAAAAQQQQQAQTPAGQPATANGSSPQAVEACLQQCSSTLNSCKSDAQNHRDSAVAKGLVGLLSKNSASVSGAASDAQDADSASSACNDEYNSCSAACQ